MVWVEIYTGLSATLSGREAPPLSLIRMLNLFDGDDGDDSDDDVSLLLHSSKYKGT